MIERARLLGGSYGMRYLTRFLRYETEAVWFPLTAPGEYVSLRGGKVA